MNKMQDPNKVINTYGADALRLYLINSPVVRAESLRFKEAGVFQVCTQRNYFYPCRTAVGLLWSCSADVLMPDIES